MADVEAAQRKTPLKLASADEIRRVLNAKTDYDCLQVSMYSAHEYGQTCMLLPALV